MAGDKPLPPINARNLPEQNWEAARAADSEGGVRVTAMEQWRILVAGIADSKVTQPEIDSAKRVVQAAEARDEQALTSGTRAEREATRSEVRLAESLYDSLVEQKKALEK